MEEDRGTARHSVGGGWWTEEDRGGAARLSFGGEVIEEAQCVGRHK